MATDIKQDALHEFVHEYADKGGKILAVIHDLHTTAAAAYKIAEDMERAEKEAKNCAAESARAGYLNTVVAPELVKHSVRAMDAAAQFASLFISIRDPLSATARNVLYGIDAGNLYVEKPDFLRHTCERALGAAPSFNAPVSRVSVLDTWRGEDSELEARVAAINEGTATATPPALDEVVLGLAALAEAENAFAENRKSPHCAANNALMYIAANLGKLKTAAAAALENIGKAIRGEYFADARTPYPIDERTAVDELGVPEPDAALVKKLRKAMAARKEAKAQPAGGGASWIDGITGKKTEVL